MPHLTLVEFFQDLAIAEITCELDIDASADESGDGTLNRATYGTRLWQGTVTIVPLRHAVADEVAAKIQYLQEADVTFDVFPNHLASVTPSNGTIVSIDANDRRNVSLSESRPVGEYIGVAFSGGKKSMHHIVKSGGAPAHVVVPALPLGAQAADVVTFGRPTIKAVLTGASLPNYRAKMAFGTTFKWIQDY